MCLILIAYQHHPRYRLILAANRDEFYDRPSQALGFWPDHPEIAAGRDLQQMGTWLGINRRGRLAAITNYREFGSQKVEAPSRGHLVADYLSGRIPTPQYLERLYRRGHLYNGFNLLMGDSRGLYYYSNRGGQASILQPGVYGLSNRLIDADWPKVRQGKARLAAVLSEQGDDIIRQHLLALLQDQTVPPDDQLPDTGVGLEWERILAPIFITSPTYGTRASSLMTIDHQSNVHLTEITWQPSSARPTLLAERQINIRIQRD